MGEGAAPRRNNEGACRRGVAEAPAGAGGWDRTANARTVGTAVGVPGDPPELGGGPGASAQRAVLGGVGSRLQDPGIRSPSLRPPLGPRGLSRPRFFPALPLALSFSLSLRVPRIPEPGGGGRADRWDLQTRALLPSSLFVSTFPSSARLLGPLFLSLCVSSNSHPVGPLLGFLYQLSALCELKRQRGQRSPVPKKRVSL